MSADDHLSPGQFYHGTATRFRKGDLVEPARQGHRSNFEDEDRNVYDPGLAYATTNLDAAWGYAKTAADKTGGLPRVYGVAPAGRYAPALEDDEFRSPAGWHVQKGVSEPAPAHVREFYGVRW